MKKAKYKVTGMFGSLNIGDIIDCYVLCQGDDSSLVYCPRINKDECGVFLICEVDNDGFYKDVNNDIYCNMTRVSKKFKQFLIDNTKPTRQTLKVKVQFNKEQLQKDIQEFKNQMKECVEQLTKSMMGDFMSKITKNVGKYVTNE